MTDEKDWAEKHATAIVSEYFIVPTGVDSKPECLIRDIAKALREAKSAGIKEISLMLKEASKIEWPSDQEIMAAHDKVYKESWGSIYNPSVWQEAVQWLKSYLQKR